MNRVPFAEQEVITRVRVVFEMEEIEKQNRHQIRARHRSAEVSELRGGDGNDVTP
jgi:hypothetical protein